jgi:hypothetical protein
MEVFLARWLLGVRDWERGKTRQRRVRGLLLFGLRSGSMGQNVKQATTNTEILHYVQDDDSKTGNDLKQATT